MVSPAARRGAVLWMTDRFGISQRRACRLTGAHRSTARYVSRRDDSGLRQALRDLAAERPRFGYRRLHALLVRSNWKVNKKRVYRVYRAEGLAVRRKKRKRVAQADRRPRQVPEMPNEQWSMDFMSDSLSSGRQFRILNIVDDATREALAAEVDTSISGRRVARVLDRIAERRPLPKGIVVDNGPEFTSQALDQWAYERGVELRFIEPGKPTENCFVESFNGKFRDECLNAHWFTTLHQADSTIQGWIEDYNEVRPHSSLGNLPPQEYADQLMRTATHPETLAAGRSEAQSSSHPSPEDTKTSSGAAWLQGRTSGTATRGEHDPTAEPQ